jgi:hypothetical protein
MFFKFTIISFLKKHQSENILQSLLDHVYYILTQCKRLSNVTFKIVNVLIMPIYNCKCIVTHFYRLVPTLNFATKLL